MPCVAAKRWMSIIVSLLQYVVRLINYKVHIAGILWILAWVGLSSILLAAILELLSQ